MSEENPVNLGKSGGEGAGDAPPPPPVNPYGGSTYAPYGGGYGPPPQHPQTTTVLALGILSVVVCGVTGPFAWVIGGRVLKEIDAAPGRYDGRGTVQVGWILGIIGTILMILGVLAFIALIAAGAILVGSTA